MNGPSDNGNDNDASPCAGSDPAMSGVACPPPAELEAFLRGERAHLSDHVDACDTCLGQLKHMTDSAAWLRTHPVVEPPPPELDQVMSQLRGGDESDDDASNHADADHSRTFEFLTPSDLP